MLNRLISEVMRDHYVVHLPPQATARQAAQEMAAKHVASIVVTETDGQLDGIFTERDLIERVISQGRNPDHVTIGEVMTNRPVTITPHVSVRQALAEMKDNHLRHLPVVENGEVVGVVSIRDFIGDEIADMDHEREHRKAVWEHLR
jgi:CBS domain-containing protein